MTRPYVQNAADIEQVRRGERKERRTEDLRHDAYRNVLNTPAGRFVLWDILEKRAGLYEPVFEPGAVDSTAYNAGRQAVGQKLRDFLLETDDDLYQTMAREAYQRTRRERLEADALATPSITDDDAT